MGTDELRHYGIKGQKWGIRRFQNEDRTWTEAGKERYGVGGEHGAKQDSTSNSSNSTRKGFDKETAKTVAKVAIAAATVAGAAYLYSQNKGKIDSLVHTMGTKFPSEIADKTSSGEAFLKKTFGDAHQSLPSTKASNKAEKIAAGMRSKAEARTAKQMSRIESKIQMKKELAIAKKKAANELADDLKKDGLSDDEIKKVVRDFTMTPGDKIREAAIGVKKRAASSASKSISKVKSTASSSVSKAKRKVNSLKPEKKTGFAKAKSDAEKKLITAAAGVAIGKAANKYIDNKLYGDKRLAEKREQNRHEEEMYRIRRNSRRRR